jgi:hypothetical protein
MNAGGLSARTRQRLSWTLVVALFPMLSFMGHWPASIPIPGTDSYLSVPLAGHEHDDDEHSEGGAHSHAQHCHGNASSCSDVPTMAGVSFGLMEQTLALAGVDALLLALVWASWTPRRPIALMPELRPPRTAAATS